MKKNHITSILLFLSSFLQAQNIQFKCYLKSNCSKDFVVLDNYILRGVNFSFFSLNNGAIATLPDTGTYTLTSPKIADDSVVIHFSRFGLYVDTLQQRDVYETVFIDSKPPKNIKNGDWLCCGKKCNGYYTDYYSNGTKYIEGKYRKGKPIGVFKLYSSTGQLKRLVYYNRQGKIFRSEDQL